MPLLEFALIGLLAGFLAGYLGIGGGIVIVPALAWIFGRDPATAGTATQMAVATSLSTMLVTSLSSIIAHHRRRAILWPVVRLIGPGLAVGAVIGAVLATQVSTRTLAVIFGVYAATAGLQLLSGPPSPRQRPLPGASGGWITGLGFGGLSSLVGIGGGSLTVPWLLWHGTPAARAIATAAACGYPIAIGGTVTFLVLSGPQAFSGGYVHWTAFAGIAAITLVSAPLGAAAVHASPPALVRRVFGVFLLLVAWKMIYP